MNTPQEQSSARTARFQRKRDAIIGIATEVMNEVGIGGMTFSDVADRIGLSAPSVTYYFKKKENLAEAVLDRGLDELHSHALSAASFATPDTRVEQFLRLELKSLARAHRGEAARRAHIGELRALEEPMGSRLNRRYVEIFRLVRGFFGTDSSESERAANIVKAHLLLDNIYAMPNWLRFYSSGDFDRVRSRMMELFRNGLMPSGGQWNSHQLSCSDVEPAAEEGQDAYLRSATKLINARGYRGASVDRIASDLQVTKGSFYHHNEAKDDLLLQCFDRTYLRITHVQRAVEKEDWTCADKLRSAMHKLLEIQLNGEEPFLRTASLQLLPLEIKGGALERSARITRRFTNLVIDGITEGSFRPVDPLLAGQALTVAINTARDLRHWSKPEFDVSAIPLIESALGTGIV